MKHLVVLLLAYLAIVLIARRIRSRRAQRQIQSSTATQNKPLNSTSPPKEELGDGDPFPNVVTDRFVALTKDPVPLTEFSNLNHFGLQLNYNDQELYRCILSVNADIMYPTSIDGISLNVGLVEIETDIGFGIDPKTFQTIICSYTFSDKRSSGGGLTCAIQQVNNNDTTDYTTTNSYVLTWDVINEVIFMSFSLKSQMATIVVADKTSFLQTKPTLNIYNNTNGLDPYYEINSTSFYFPVTIIYDDSQTAPDPSSYTLYDFQFYYNTSGYAAATTANSIFDGVQLYTTTDLPNQLQPYQWYGDPAVSAMMAFPPNTDQVAQLLFSVNPPVAYNLPYTPDNYPELGSGSPPTYDFNEVQYSVMILYNLNKQNVTTLQLSYSVTATFDEDMQNIIAMTGSIIVSGVMYDPFSPYYRQYVQWDVLAQDIVVIRADYANQNCLIAILNNPNGDGSSTSVKHSMLVPMPNGQYLALTDQPDVLAMTQFNPNPYVYISVGEQNINPAGVTYYYTNNPLVPQN